MTTLIEGMAKAIIEVVQLNKAALTAAAGCVHEWTDARNEVVESGEVCLKCNAIRAGNAAAKEK